MKNFIFSTAGRWASILGVTLFLGWPLLAVAEDVQTVGFELAEVQRFEAARIWRRAVWRKEAALEKYSASKIRLQRAQTTYRWHPVLENRANLLLAQGAYHRSRKAFSDTQRQEHQLRIRWESARLKHQQASMDANGAETPIELLSDSSGDTPVTST